MIGPEINEDLEKVESEGPRLDMGRDEPPEDCAKPRFALKPASLNFGSH